ncbi:hypothetical protein NFJ02_19g34750 [Pycnococcus provasolii]
MSLTRTSFALAAMGALACATLTSVEAQQPQQPQLFNLPPIFFRPAMTVPNQQSAAFLGSGLGGGYGGQYGLGMTPIQNSVTNPPTWPEFYSVFAGQGQGTGCRGATSGNCRRRGVNVGYGPERGSVYSFDHGFN